MAETTFRESPLVEGRWACSSFMYGRIHGWSDRETRRVACVRAGPDSLARAKALLAAHPDAQGIMDAEAAAMQALAWRNLQGDDES